MKVVVTGATGATGAIVTRKLLERGFKTRATARSEAKADDLRLKHGPGLEVVMVDLTGPRARRQLAEAFSGADALVVCTSAQPRLLVSSLPSTLWGRMVGSKEAKPGVCFPERARPRDVDYDGTVLQVQAAVAARLKHVVLLSSMGGTDPEHSLNADLEKMAMWKRLAAKYLVASGVPYTIIHAGGPLPTHHGHSSRRTPGGERALVVSTDDRQLRHTCAHGHGLVPREDVAEVMVLALVTPEARGRSFDLVSHPRHEGTPFDGDLRALLATLDGRNSDYTDPADLELLLGMDEGAQPAAARRSR